MLISCNRLKNYISESDTIDWLKLWDTFTVRTAEVENVTTVGKDITNVVVAEIVKCESHPTKDKYHILEVNDGQEIHHILCGAPNVRVGIKVALIRVGGTIGDIVIEPKEIAGVLSSGMLCSERELGISDNHEGIMELPNNFELGKDIKAYIPMEDIIVEIDNKSLTNRPDLWGHYGIAREVAAITNYKLLPLAILEPSYGQETLSVSINEKALCRRYSALKIGNITKKELALADRIFLYHVGMRSISLIVDLTNILMLELGQPMHAFDGNKVKDIAISLAKNGTKFTTLDNNEWTLSNKDLVIEVNGETAAIAGVMGGLDSEIKADTKDIILESANFDATNIRKTATSLGLRTEASARYEKSLDPELTMIAIKRFLKLLSDNDADIKVLSPIIDQYPLPYPEIKISLSKNKLLTYLGTALAFSDIKKYLLPLGFSITENKETYLVDIPSYRATKDISLDADIIEEISRMYGYENIVKKPLELALDFKSKETTYEEEYAIKYYLANQKLHEVHTYLWYQTNFLNKLNLNKSNTYLKGKKEDQILRDDLNLSLLAVANDNLKNYSEALIFEIGTEIKVNEQERVLSIVWAGDKENTATSYYNLKKIIASLFLQLKNKQVNFIKATAEEIYDKDYCFDIVVDNQIVGQINIFNASFTNNLNNKKSYLCAKIKMNEYYQIINHQLKYKAVSKYPVAELDYTINTPLNTNYNVLEEVLTNFKDGLINDWELVNVFNKDEELHYTIRYYVGSSERTLNQNDLSTFKESFMHYIKENGFVIKE